MGALSPSRVAAPFTVTRLGRSARYELLQQGTEVIMRRIAALLPPEYREAYDDSPRLKALLAKDAN